MPRKKSFSFKDIKDCYSEQDLFDCFCLVIEFSITCELISERAYPETDEQVEALTKKIIFDRFRNALQEIELSKTESIINLDALEATRNFVKEAIANASKPLKTKARGFG